MPKQTADTVALILAIVVAVVTLLTALTLAYTKIVHPEINGDQAFDAMGRIISVLVGALVGYMAGRRVDS
jgi:hypothetical protein